MTQIPKLHETTAQNYAHTQDVAEGLRSKLRELENAQAKLRSERDVASRAAEPVTVVAPVADPDRVTATAAPVPRKNLKLLNDKLDNLQKEHAAVKAELDALEGNPVSTPEVMTAPRTQAEAQNLNAIAQVNAVSAGTPAPKPLAAPKEVAAAPETQADKARREYQESHATILQANKVAQAGAIKQAVTNVLTNSVDPAAALANIQDATAAAVAQVAETEANTLKQPAVSTDGTGPDFVKNPPFSPGEKGSTGAQ